MVMIKHSFRFESYRKFIISALYCFLNDKLKRKANGTVKRNKIRLNKTSEIIIMMIITIAPFK